ncbi:MAG: hypothetical protein H7338_03945 [Candidatus Sericytochromatia bacterium]|nr:hypothetical protein [Candidatus Sericytochromatia bacterium]
MFGTTQSERPLIYGISGRSRWLLEAGLVIWNVVGLLAVVALAQGLRTGRVASRPAGTGTGDRTPHQIPVDVSGAAQMAHARSVVGDLTNEDILARELARSGMGAQDRTSVPTSEDILAAELARSQRQKPPTGHGESSPG